MCVREINEGDIELLYAMKVVPPKDIGSNVCPNTNIFTKKYYSRSTTH